MAVANAFNSPIAALGGALERFAQITRGVTAAAANTGRFGLLLARTNDNLAEFTKSSDTVCDAFSRLTDSCARLVGNLERGGGGAIQRTLGTNSQLALSGGSLPGSIAAVAATPPAAKARAAAAAPSAPPETWKSLGMKFLGLDDDGEKGWVDRGQEDIKAARGTRYLLRNTPLKSIRHVIPGGKWLWKNVVNSAKLTHGLDVGDGVFNMWGDVQNVARGFRDMGDPKKGVWEGLKGVLGGIGGLNQDSKDLRSDFKDLMESLGLGSKGGGGTASRLARGLTRFAGMGEEAATIGEGGLALTATAGEGAAIGGTAVEGGGALAGLMGGLEMTPVGWALTGAAALGLAGYEVYEHWKPIKGFFSNLWHEAAPAFKWGWDNIAPYVPGVNLVKSIVDNWTPISQHLQPAMRALSDGFKWTWNNIVPYVPGANLVKDVVDNWQRVPAMLGPIWNSVADFAVGLGDIVSKGVQQGWQAAKSFAQSVWSGFMQKVQSAWNTASSYVSQKAHAAWDAVASRAHAAWTTVSTAASNVAHKVADAVKSRWTQVTGIVSNLWHGATGLVSQAWSRAQPYIARAGNAVKAVLDKTGATGFFHRIAGAVSTVTHGIANVVHNIGSALDSVRQRGHAIRQKAAGEDAARQRAQHQTALKHVAQQVRTHAAATEHAHRHLQRMPSHRLAHHPRSGMYGGGGAPAAGGGARAAAGPVYATGPVRATGPVSIAPAASVQLLRPAVPREHAGQHHARGSADIRVRFENTPPGTRVSTRSNGAHTRFETGVSFGH